MQKYHHLQTNNYQVVFDDWAVLEEMLNDVKYSNILLIVDENTSLHCLPILKKHIYTDFQTIIISSGEEHKNIDTCKYIYSQMLALGLDRKSLCVNLGGGVIGDMGGFCAATYMRGMDFVQIPTTLLSQVDASVGGKLGIDFQGVKNIVGIFQEPKMVFISPQFLKTLATEQLKSGYAEILKHALIQDKQLWNKLQTSHSWEDNCDVDTIYHSILIKNKVVSQDWKEVGLRKILNFGHTIGHAVESLSFEEETPLLHGNAVAIGILCESHIAQQKGYLGPKDFLQIEKTITKIYGHHPRYVMEYDKIIALMKHDKKNDRGKILCSFIDQIGNCLYDQMITHNEVQNSLAYYAKIGQDNL